MANPFTARRPWAAAILSFFLGPFIAMLYLGRGRMALLYFAAGLLYAAICLAFAPNILASASPTVSFWLLQLPFEIVGTVHAFVLARRRSAAEPRRWYARWYALIGFIALSPAIALAIRTFLFEPFDIASGSMSPSLNVGDYLLVSKFAYDARPPGRGDIVVFHVPALGGAAYVKRIVGLPGERIRMTDGILFVNGAPVPKRRVADFLQTDAFGAVQHVPQFAETLPGGRIVLVLDRGESDFDNTEVFTVPAGSYFVLGDNRDNSDDSRGNEGYVSRDRIVGPPVIKYLAGGRWTWQPIN